MSAPLPADDLIARCRRVYAECETYADEGEQRTKSIYLEGTVPTHAKLLRFQTRWTRPDRFRFEFRTAHFGDVLDQLFVIWTASGGVRSWWTLEPRVRKYKKLQDSLGAAAGVSGTTSCQIPLLLLAQGSQRTLPDVTGLRGEQVEHEGSRCLVIVVPSAHPGAPQTERRLWIDVATALILRVEEKVVYAGEAYARHLEHGLRELEASGERSEMRAELLETMRGGLSTETTTVFRPRLDVPIDDTEFEFTPPTSAGTDRQRVSWWVLVSLACPIVMVLAEFGISRTAGMATPWVSGLASVVGMLAGALAWLRSRRMRWLSALGMTLNAAPWVILGLYAVGLWRPT